MTGSVIPAILLRMRPRHPAPHRGLALVLATTVIALSALVAAGPVAAAAPLHDCIVADTLTKHRALADWPRSLLDMEYRLASTYKPADLRSTADAGLNSGYQVRTFVIADLKAMAAAAKAAGARFSVQSAYRSYATQQSTFQYWVDLHGYARALTESARAGHSEHQLGTTLDLRSYGGPAPWDVTDWATTKAGKWIAANAWKYGFVLSYPKGKSGITCYDYEPWHVRYVGKARAAAVHGTALTYREYLWAQQNATPTTLLPGPTSRP